ncbi:mitochondrial substrate carrier protein [Coccomyxa subellipsoidea C-169]|uniref:Mitochondrial substrate carrier protein n=1 Tax=Coccomyxa subellipsoidea (strain C-169) TaxID=574566 RepID=I0ZAL2_COCSC|nr:mitochondrial substrate carrier protein [Coccomyxa subellipsoidea C-169]EIE27681.1 mitochondrial substrate carrier protein [Coccomyxa subellipsoidea C-169]|eukprot:XP_005652225.1 mitochondrial substrate carrier protein [Coccomyxa subellipsoidea C-169]
MLCRVFPCLPIYRLFLCGGFSGAIARTATAPLERIKLLSQVQAIAAAASSRPAVYKGIGPTAAKIYREEGLRAFWKGNGTNVVRIFPYSAVQFSANEKYKRLLATKDGKLTVGQRLTAGAFAGMSAVAVTHPLDVIRLRLSLPRAGYTGMTNALVTIMRTEGSFALYKGFAPALIGTAPFAALNFASYDLLKKYFFDLDVRPSTAGTLGMGAASGLLASSVCFPLDTVRRQMQMRACTYTSQANAISTIWHTEGYRGFYRGWTANALKVLPQNSLRFASYEALKTFMGV